MACIGMMRDMFWVLNVVWGIAMSQIETVMLIILGFAVALLLVLILGKLLWGKAAGLGKRRSRREDPVTIAALQADKDKLRAEAAMLSRKLELRLNDLKTRLAEQMAEVSRNRNRVDHLAGEINERNALVAKRDTEIEKLKTQMVPLEQELVIRTEKNQELTQQLLNKEKNLLDKTVLIDDLQLQLNISLAEGTVKTSTSGEVPLLAQTEMPKQIDAIADIDLSAKDRLQSRISDLTALSKQIEDQRLQLTRQHTQLKDLTDEILAEKTPPKEKFKEKTADKSSSLDLLDNSSTRLEQQLTEAERETDALQKELTQLDEDWNDKLKQIESVKPAETKPSGKTKKTTKKTTEKKAKNKDNDNGTNKATDKDDLPSNVVTLASRIRSLQSDIKDQKK